MLVGIGMQWVSQVTDFLGKILILAGGPVLVAYAAVRVFAKSWLKHELDIRVASFQARQAEQLEAIKARNAEQLEQARHRLNTLFRQTSKLHEKEFEVLANAWERLNEALVSISVFFGQNFSNSRPGSPVQRQFLREISDNRIFAAPTPRGCGHELLLPIMVWP